jgi:hypothetical protein
MHVLLTGISLLGSTFLVHLLLWRIRLPQSHTMALLGVFTFTPLILYLLVRPAWTWELLHIALFYTSCTLVYINLYSLIEEESPTLSIIARIKTAPDGCTKEDLQKLFVDKNPLERRIGAMLSSGLLLRNNLSYTLTSKGQAIARIFTIAARIIGLKQGG